MDSFCLLAEDLDAVIISTNVTQPVFVLRAPTTGATSASCGAPFHNPMEEQFTVDAKRHIVGQVVQGARPGPTTLRPLPWDTIPGDTVALRNVHRWNELCSSPSHHLEVQAGVALVNNTNLAFSFLAPTLDTSLCVLLASEREPALAGAVRSGGMFPSPTPRAGSASAS